MRRLAFVAASVLFVACGTQDEPSPEPGILPEPPAPAASAATIEDFAGTWDSEVTLEGVAEPVPVTMNGAAGSGQWTMDLEGRPGIDVQVSMAGDSLIAESAEYESVLRPGVMVKTRTASVLRDGMLIGNVLATYRTADGEEQASGTIRGTRVR